MSILLVDADAEMLDILAYLLRRDGFDVLSAHDGVEALQAWQTRDPQLVLSDSDLPNLSGSELCKRIRSESATPFIFLSAAGGEEAIVRGLDSGADDYITKPFSPGQLLARVRAVLRRSQGRTDVTSKGRETLRVGDLTVDPQFRTVERDGNAVALTPTEFKLLYELLLHEGQVLTHKVLTDRVWGYADVDDTNIVKGQIYNLRRKLERDPANPVYIHTIAGSGYVFRRSSGTTATA